MKRRTHLLLQLVGPPFEGLFANVEASPDSFRLKSVEVREAEKLI